MRAKLSLSRSRSKMMPESSFGLTSPRSFYLRFSAETRETFISDGLLQIQEKYFPAIQKRAIPMITVPANELVFKAKSNVGMETSRAG
jgi:hypothetical protein